MAKRASGRTGPITAEGKERSSQNARKHCLCSKAAIVAGEDAKERVRLLESWLAKYQPVDECERRMVLDVAANEWYQRRAVKQFDGVDAELNSIDPLEWEEEDHKRFERFLRYKTAAERAFTRSLRTLEQQRKIQVQTEREEAKARLAAKLQEEAERAPKDILSPDAPWRKVKLRMKMLQMIQVRIEEGKTVTRPYPTNEMMQRWPDSNNPEIEVYRTFEFPNGIPAEYAWVTEDEEERRNPARFEQRLSLAAWLRAIERDAASGSGHMCSGEDSPQAI